MSINVSGQGLGNSVPSRRKLMLSTALAACLAAGFASLPGGASAQTIYWDGADGTGDGNVDGGAGTWDTTATNWTNSAGNSTVAFVNGDTVSFDGTGGAVTASGSLTVGGMSVNASGYTFAGTAGTDGVTGTFNLNAGFETSFTDFFLAGSDVTLTGGGTVNIAGTNTGDILANSGANLNLAGAWVGTVENDGSVVASTLTGGAADFVNTDGTMTLSGVAASVSNEGTLTVNGALDVSAGAFDNSDDGAITIDASVSNVGSATFVGGSGPTTSSVTLTSSGVLSAATISNGNNAILTNGGTIVGALSNVSGGQVTSTGTIVGTFNNAGTASLSGVADQVDNTGDLTVTGALSLGSDVLNNSGSGTVTINGALTAATVTNSGTGIITNNAGVTGNVANNSGASFINEANVTGTVTNAGTWSGTAGTVTGNVSTSGDFTAGSGGVSGNVSVTDGTFDNAGANIGGTLTIDAIGAATISGGTISGNITNNGVLDVAGDFSAGADFTNNLSVTNDTDGDYTVGVTGTFTNDTTGTINAGSGSLIFNAATVINNGAITGDVTLSGALTNTGTTTLTGTLGGTLTNDGGTVNVGAAAVLDAAGNDVTNQNAGIINVNDNSFTGIGILNNSATINIGTGETLDAATINNLTGGDINVAGTLQGTGNTLNNSATIDVADGGTITDAGDINNLATGIINYEGGGTLNSDTDVITNAGTINIGTLGAGTVDANGGNLTQSGSGVLDVQQGSFTNLGTVTNGGNGVIDIAAGADMGVISLTNDVNGSLTVDGTLDASSVSSSAIDNVGTMVIGGAGDVTANVTNTGTLTMNGGQIDGNLANLSSGAASIGGTITGLLNNGNTATLSIIGDTTVNGALTNNSTSGSAIDVGAGFTLAADTVTLNAGTTNVQAGATLEETGDDDVIHVGTNGSLISAGTLDSGVDVAGSFTSTGAINGDVTGLSGGGALLEGTMTGNLVMQADSLTAITAGGLVLTGNASTTNTASLVLSNSTLDISGTLTNNSSALLSIDAGDTLTVASGMTSTGNVDNAGTINADVTNDGTGEVELALGSTLNGTLTNNSTSVTAVVVSGDAAATAVDTTTGTTTVNAGATLTLDGGTGTLAASGDAAVVLAGSIDGNYTGTDTSALTLGLGGVTGDVTTSGTATIATAAGATIGGTLTVGSASATALTVDHSLSADTITLNAGTTTVNSTLEENGDDDIIEVAGTATLVNNGLLDSGVNVSAAGATLTNTSAISGNVTNAGTMTQSSAGSITGDLLSTGDTDIAGSVTGTVTVGSGTFDVTGGDLAVGGTFVNSGGTLALDDQALNVTGGFTQASGTLTVDAGDTITAAAMTNSADMIVDGTVTSAGVFNNSGALTINSTAAFSATTLNNAGDLTMNDATVSGAVAHTGTSMTLTGANTITGALSGSSDIGMDDGIAGTTLDVGGDLSLSGTINMDVDLSSGSTAYDAITVAGNVTGTVALAFTDVSGGSAGLLGSTFTVLDAASFTGTVTGSGLPAPGGAVEYIFQTNDAAGDAFITTVANPAIGGVASGVALTQSLIGVVVNRPSSPFVSGLAYVDENPCGKGTWARVTGGIASATADATSGGFTTSNDVDADYYGIQGGFDWGCFDGRTKGWDVAYGGILGYNAGSTSQDVTSLLNPNLITSRLTSDFTQAFAGGYVAASKGPIAADLQLRYEDTKFLLTDVAVSGTAFGFNNTPLNTSAVTLSGSVSYAKPLNDQGLNFVPTAGIGLTWTNTDDLIINDQGNADPNDDEVLVTDNHLAAIGFIGGTLAKTTIGGDGLSAFNKFVTATVYNDFGGDRSATLYDGGGGQQSISSSGLGFFGELSGGVSYVKILDEGQIGAAKQLNASVRADARFGDGLESYGLTAQVRLQF